MIGDKGHLGFETSIITQEFGLENPNSCVYKTTINGVSHESPINKITYDDVCFLAYGKVINGLTCTWSGKSGKGGFLTQFDKTPLTLNRKSTTHFTIVSTSNS